MTIAPSLPAAAKECIFSGWLQRRRALFPENCPAFLEHPRDGRGGSLDWLNCFEGHFGLRWHCQVNRTACVNQRSFLLATSNLTSRSEKDLPPSMQRPHEQPIRIQARLAPQRSADERGGARPGQSSAREPQVAAGGLSRITELF